MSKFLEEFAACAADRGLNLFSVTEIKDGVSETLQLVPTNLLQNTYSVAKAFTVTAIGLLYDKGLVDTSEVIVDILGDECPEYADKRWEKVTVDMALTHRIGLPGGSLDIDANDPLTFGQDYLKYTLNIPFESDPGTQYRYTDAAFYLLARVVDKRAGAKTDDFLWRELFSPLSFREVAWSHCPMGHPMGATGLYICCADMAKLGWLYHQNGVWEGKRILSEKWVNIVRERGYELRPTDIGKSYGKGGMFGQWMLIVPESDRVAAWQGYVTGGKGGMCDFVALYKD